MLVSSTSRRRSDLFVLGAITRILRRGDDMVRYPHENDDVSPCQGPEIDGHPRPQRTFIAS